jgi:hypothetical protein
VDAEMERNVYFKCRCGKVLAVNEAGVGRIVKSWKRDGGVKKLKKSLDIILSFNNL